MRAIDKTNRPGSSIMRIGAYSRINLSAAERCGILLSTSLIFIFPVFANLDLKELLSQANLLMRKGETDTATRIYQNICTVRDSAPPNALVVNEAELNLSTIYFLEGSYKKSERHCQIVLSSLEDSLGKDSLQLVPVLRNLAKIQSIKNHSKAAASLERMLNLERAALPDEMHYFARELRQLWYQYNLNLDFEKEVRVLKEVLELEPAGKQAATDNQSLAIALLLQGKTEDSLPFLKRSLALYKKYGTSNPGWPRRSRYHYGAALCLLGKTSEGKAIIDSCLAELSNDFASEKLSTRYALLAWELSRLKLKDITAEICRKSEQLMNRNTDKTECVETARLLTNTYKEIQDTENKQRMNQIYVRLKTSS